MKYDDLEEYSLLKLIYQGNHDAFWQLWLLHKDYLYYRCLSWMGSNHTEAENLLSQASLKAYEKLPHYASKIINVKAWLTTLTHNLCLDMFLQKKEIYYKVF